MLWDAALLPVSTPLYLPPCNFNEMANKHPVWKVSSNLLNLVRALGVKESFCEEWKKKCEDWGEFGVYCLDGNVIGGITIWLERSRECWTWNESQIFSLNRINRLLNKHFKDFIGAMILKNHTKTLNWHGAI